MTGPTDLGTVLVVDDEPQIVAFVRLALEDEGYAVATASDGTEALVALDAMAERSAWPHLILVDLRMPGMDGKTFVRTYRERAAAMGTPPAPVIVFTASRVPAEDAAALGAEGVLRKPFQVDALLDAVARFLKTN
ncbi:MAG TPA: response regulator [Chloroflexota bacterium]|nr:response regulator [Chloroflexota bacterium]